MSKTTLLFMGTTGWNIFFNVLFSVYSFTVLGAINITGE